MCVEFVSILCPSQPSSSLSKLPIQFFREMHAARETFDTRTTITKRIILEYSSSANNNVRVIITFVIYVKHAVWLSNSRYSVSSTASVDFFFFSSLWERHDCPPFGSSFAEEIASRIHVRAMKNQTATRVRSRQRWNRVDIYVGDAVDSNVASNLPGTRRKSFSDYYLWRDSSDEKTRAPFKTGKSLSDDLHTYRGYWKNDGEKLEERAATGFSGR